MAVKGSSNRGCREWGGVRLPGAGVTSAAGSGAWGGVRASRLGVLRSGTPAASGHWGRWQHHGVGGWLGGAGWCPRLRAAVSAWWSAARWKSFRMKVLCTTCKGRERNKTASTNFLNSSVICLLTNEHTRHMVIGFRYFCRLRPPKNIVQLYSSVSRNIKTLMNVHCFSMVYRRCSLIDYS
jgi:hypothetical protein